MKDEALKQVLEAITQYLAESPDPSEEAVEGLCDAASAARKALAQPEQEPVALRHSFDGYGYLYTDMGFGSGWIEWTKRSHKDAEPLYTTPPQRTWVGLTEQERNDMEDFCEMIIGKAAFDAIEAKLKEKNT